MTQICLTSTNGSTTVLCIDTYEKTHPNRCGSSHCPGHIISSWGIRCIRRVRNRRKHSPLTRRAPGGGYPRHHSYRAWYLPGRTRASWHYRWLGTTHGTLVGAATRFGAGSSSSPQHPARHGSWHLHVLGIAPRTGVSVAGRLNTPTNRLTMLCNETRPRALVAELVFSKVLLRHHRLAKSGRVDSTL